MNRFAFLVLATLTLGACAEKTEEDAGVLADTAQMPLPAEPAGVSLAEIAGTWRVDVSPVDKDTIVLSYTLWASGDTSQWKMKFDDRADTMKVNIVGMAGDSVVTRFGPYSSALRPNVSVVTEAVNRMQNGQLNGSVTARYSVTTADSVMRFRLAGTRTQ